MSPAAFFERWAGYGAVALTLAALGLSLLLVQRAQALRAAGALPGGRGTSPVVRPADVPDLAGLDAGIFRGRLGAGALASGGLATRYRLAGTFFQMEAGDGPESRMAILDDLAAAKQMLVRELDAIDGITVVRIERDRVRLRDAAGAETELTLNFTGGAGREAGAAGGSAEAAGSAGGAGGGAYGSTRTGENRWKFDRAALLRYYQGLRDQPERLVQLFDSLKPEYGANHRITGYRLGVEGEREFFDAVGLAEGDIVRRVNNVEMTNRRRAEFFVSQFVRDEANGFVLDVERSGVTNRLTYEIR